MIWKWLRKKKKSKEQTANVKAKQKNKLEDKTQDMKQPKNKHEPKKDKQLSVQDAKQAAQTNGNQQQSAYTAKHEAQTQDKQQQSAYTAKHEAQTQDKQQQSAYATKHEKRTQDKQQQPAYATKHEAQTQNKQQQPAYATKQEERTPDKRQQSEKNNSGNSIYDFSKPEQEHVHSLQDLLDKLKASSDFVSYHTSDDETMPYWISYYRPSLDGEKLQKYLMPALLERTCSSLEELKEHIPMSGVTITNDLQKIEDMVLKGHAIVQLHNQDQKCILANIAIDNYRAPTVPLNESTVIGPQEGFVEDIDTNINLVRKRLPVLALQTKEVIVGKFSKTKVVMMYLENLAEKENVDYLEESLRTIEYDQINDSSYIQELMGEKSIFPLFINTERTDRVTTALIDGKIAIFVDGSPNILLTPVSYFDFFVSPEDYNVSWLYATFSRFLRLIAVLFSICATPLYVAILSYHYELIPSDLLETLILSRAQVPFPPLIEAIFLELAIDLLREAGARLPMKVGQTLGIVGGIVIGQASVQAGLTSNILLIIVALSALASFITPIYKMGNAVRLLRFPFLLCAELGGLLGISLGFVLLFTHLFRLSSLRKPFALFYPARLQALKDSWIRLPLSMIDTRDIQARPQHVKKSAKGISTKHTSDFDD